MDFTVTLASPRVRIVEGASATVGITVARNGFIDAVAVKVDGLPAGVTADSLTIVGDAGTLTLHAVVGATQGESGLTVTVFGGSQSHDVSLSLLAMGLPGTLDKSFSPGTPSSLVGRGNAVAIQADGNIVIAGQASRTTEDILVARYLPEGTLDPRFSGGIIAFDATTQQDESRAVALQPDGKIVVAGRFSRGGGNSVGLVVRFNIDGSPDNEFGTGGRVELALNAFGTFELTELNAIALQSDGGIVVAGTTSGSTSDLDAVVARITRAGAIDNGFGTLGGYTTVQFGTVTDHFSALAIQPDDRIVAAGAGAQPDNPSMAVFARFTAGGRLDSSFSGDGTLPLGVLTGGDTLKTVTSVIVQPDGKLVAAGAGTGPSIGGGACLVRLNGNDGSVDKVIGLTSQYRGGIGALALQTDGKFVLGGVGEVAADGSRNAIIGRVTAEAGLDTGFAGGVVTNDSFGTGDGAFSTFDALAIDSDGRIVVAGYFVRLGVYQSDRVTIARYWP